MLHTYVNFDGESHEIVAGGKMEITAFMRPPIVIEVIDDGHNTTTG